MLPCGKLPDSGAPSASWIAGLASAAARDVLYGSEFFSRLATPKMPRPPIAKQPPQTIVGTRQPRPRKTQANRLDWLDEGESWSFTKVMISLCRSVQAGSRPTADLARPTSGLYHADFERSPRPQTDPDHDHY